MKVTFSCRTDQWSLVARQNYVGLTYFAGQSRLLKVGVNSCLFPYVTTHTAWNATVVHSSQFYMLNI